MSGKQTNAEKAYLIAKIFVEEKDIIRFKDNFYQYVDGIWEKRGDERIKSEISREYTLEFSATTTNQIKEVTRSITDITYQTYHEQIEHLQTNPTTTINLADGIFDIKTKTTKPYTRDDFKFHKLPFTYKQNPFSHSFMHFLTTSMNFPDDIYQPEKAKQYKEEQPDLWEEYLKTIRFIQEWMGYSLLPGNLYHKNLIMFGDGRNGKGILKDVWSLMLGQTNVSYLDLSSINDERVISATKNKLVNFSPDLKAGQQLDTGTIKAAASGEEVQSNEKFKQPEMFRFTAKLVISCNDLPYIKNIGAAVRERFFVLPFNRVFSEHERDHHLLDKLKNDLEDIFSWAVVGLERLQERGRFEPPHMCTTQLEEYLLDNDTIAMYINEEQLVSEDPEDKVLKSTFYDNYKYYCTSSNYKPLGRNKFYTLLRKKGFKEVKVNGARYLKGLRDVDSIKKQEALDNYLKHNSK